MGAKEKAKVRYHKSTYHERQQPRKLLRLDEPC